MGDFIFFNFFGLEKAVSHSSFSFFGFFFIIKQFNLSHVVYSARIALYLSCNLC